MIPIKHIDPDDLALYAMQLLSPNETEEMSLHLQHSAEARRVLSELYADLSVFAYSAEMHSPPALARQRLMKHVAREKKAIPIDRFADAYAPRATSALLEEAPVKTSAIGKVLPWIGWAVAAGLGLEAVNLYQQKTQLIHTVVMAQEKTTQTQMSAELANAVMETVKDPTAIRVTLSGTDQRPPPTGRINYVQDKGSLLLLASNLEPLQPYKTYELWLIPADGRDAIPAGTFKPDVHGNASLVLPELPKGIAAKAFGVTIEDGDGTQVPTMPIVLKGAVS